MERIYKVGKLRQVVREEAMKNEFKPKYGDGVPEADKKINGKAYKDMEKETSTYNGGVKVKKPKNFRMDDNKGMSDLMYNGEVPEEFIKNNESRLKGYTSAENERLHKGDPFGNADFGTEQTVRDIKAKAKKFKQGRDTATEIGLTGRELDKKDVERNRTTMFGESRKIKKLTFKNIEFLTEGHMISRIPDNMKTEGNRFIMRDSSNNEYLVEWTQGKPEVTKMLNEQKVQEESDRIRSLYNYQHSDYFKNTTNKSRLQEESEFSNMIGKVRSLMK